MVPFKKPIQSFFLIIGLALGLGACGQSGQSASNANSGVSVSGSGVTVDVLATASWSGGFSGAVRITNNSYASSITSFEVVFNMGSATIAGSAWNGTITGPDSSGNYTAVNPSYLQYSPITTGNSWDVGFNGSGTFSSSTIVSVKINGTTIEFGDDDGDDDDDDDTTTDGVFRVDSSGNITKNGTVLPVRCGSWFGLEGHYEISTDETNPRGAPMELYVGNMWWANGGSGTGRTIQQTMSEITAAGINVVRMPVVHQTLDATDPQGMDPNLKNHEDVRVANSRLALEQWITAAAANNIQVILDIHSCSNYVGWRKGRLDARPPYVDADRDDYDFTREDCSCAASDNPSSVTRIQAYNESVWLQDLKTLAGLGDQLGVDNILGIDIFNEPWDYSWEEWKTLTEHAYEAINSVNPNVLLFVQGIGTSSGNQDGSPTTTTATPHGDEATNPNWGENLYEAGANPPNIPKERLVFSPHTYGPSVFVQKMFMDPAQPECEGLEGDAAGDAECNIVINSTLLRTGWEEHFGYLKDMGYAVVVGEFGGNLEWPAGKASERDRDRYAYLTDTTTDAQWQNAFVDYMVSKGIEGCYWSINPESGDTGGWYGHVYDPVSNTGGWGEWESFISAKTTLLKELWGM